MPQICLPVLSSAFSRPKHLPQSSLPARYSFLLRFNRPCLTYAHLSTPLMPLYPLSGAPFCLEHP